jgi:hypothetical protein
MPSKRKQTQEPEPTEAELVELDELAAKLPAEVRMNVGGEVLDRAAIRRHLGELRAIAKAKRVYEEAVAKMRAIRPEAEAYMAALKEIPELRAFCK